LIRHGRKGERGSGVIQAIWLLGTKIVLRPFHEQVQFLKDEVVIENKLLLSAGTVTSFP
jgi:hypothetical protein